MRTLGGRETAGDLEKVVSAYIEAKMAMEKGRLALV